MKVDVTPQAAAFPARLDRRDPTRPRVLGYLVSLNGLHGVIACQMTAEATVEHWSVGNLISVVHESSRLVGVVCELMTSDQRWNSQGVNLTLVKIELSGEVVDEAGKPVFYRGVRSFPNLGAVAHRIRAEDLSAIYTIRGAEGVEIGSLTQNPSIVATVNMTELTKRHFAVVGSTGVGKTTAVSMLLKRCLRDRPDLRVLIVDPHNEYAGHFPDESVVLHSDNLELPYWMFRFDEFVDIIYGGRKTNPEETEALYEVIRAAKARFGAASASRLSESVLRRPSQGDSGISADTPVPYRVSDAAQIIEEWIGKLDGNYARADLRSLKYRLEALSQDPRYRFMFGKVLIDDVMAKVLGQIFRVPTACKPVTIVQVAGLPNEVVNAVVSVLARMAFEIALASGGRYKITLLCEEAHRYLPADASDAFAPTRRALGRIAREGRKYGVSLGVVTQRPADVDATVLSQCSTMFAMRLANDRDKAIVGAAAGVSSTGALSFLSSLADREAIAFGEAIATPMRMKFSDYRQFEKSQPALSARPEEAAATASSLRAIVARMRGEGSGEAAALRSA